MWKKFAVGNIVIIALCVFICCYFLFPTKDLGIIVGSWHTYDEFTSYAADKSVRLMEEGTELLENADYYIEAMSEGKIGIHYDLEVYIGQVTSDLILQQGSMYEQSFNILEVISGTAEEGQQIGLYTQGGFTVDGDEALFVGNLLCKNVMKPGNVYLIFCEKAEYQDDDYIEYRVVYGLLNTLCLNQDDEFYTDDDEITDTWAQFSDRELLTDSNELISEFNELKQAMFDKWGIDRTKYME